MEEDLKRPSHISYKEYQKKVTKNPNEGIIIFVSAFFILLLLFLGIAKQISPEVDVSIGDDTQQTTVDDDMYKSSVDARLKLLQEEDNRIQDDKMFNDSLEEKVVIPEDKEAHKTAWEKAENEYYFLLVSVSSSSKAGEK